ncbi:hypothetical protein BOTBODRAFT_168892 [Botryobasidium botryosum FD-172 SS1]|uniref:Transmembrane protein n=1 Tax=Botryobasidium botryosum (strain FD-172 SS1) TaxID=930990 RepID=A0A067NC02_BOTB1|nr:hypothetical protein BOTBODRAFT_168892 [Botryobasidium botryosum FD-172 SS1]
MALEFSDFESTPTAPPSPTPTHARSNLSWMYQQQLNLKLDTASSIDGSSPKYHLLMALLSSLHECSQYVSIPSSPFSLDLVAFAVPTPNARESATAHHAPLAQLQSVKSELNCIVEELGKSRPDACSSVEASRGYQRRNRSESNNQYKSVRSNEGNWQGTFNTVAVQLNVVVTVFSDYSFVSEIDVQEIAGLVAAILIDIVIILYAALKAGADCNDYISSIT